MKILLKYYTLIPAFIWVLSIINELLVYILPNIINRGYSMLFRMLGYEINAAELGSSILVKFIAGCLLLGICVLEWKYIKKLMDKVKILYNISRDVELTTNSLLVIFTVKLIITFVCSILNISVICVLHPYAMAFGCVITLITTVVYLVFENRRSRN